jgi:hypothetical protein
MNAEELAGVWTTIEPTLPQRRRIDAHVFGWLEARDTSLAAEWLGLFRVRPFASLGLATASALSIAAAPPLVWFARALF